MLQIAINPYKIIILYLWSWNHSDNKEAYMITCINCQKYPNVKQFNG